MSSPLAAMLGPVAKVPPSPAAGLAIRQAVLRPRDQYPKTDQQAFPRGMDGPDPYAYAVHAGIVTAEEIRPFLIRWRDEEKLNRGLGTGAPKAAAEWKDPETGAIWLNKYGDPIKVTIHDCQHETFQQYLTGKYLLEGDELAARQVDDLVSVVLDDPTLEPGKLITNSRQLGRPLVALMQEGSHRATQGAGILMSKVYAQMGTKDGQPYYVSNVKAGADHDGKPWSIQQESTILSGFAHAYEKWPMPSIRDAIYHGIGGLAAAQQEDGSFANDVGPDGPDADLEADEYNPGQVMDLWCLAGLIRAKWALGPLWPGKAQQILNRARQLWLATDYTRPASHSFKKHPTLSITIACAAEYGWRA